MVDSQMQDYFWSHSTTVLTWNHRQENWVTFVDNRVKEILNHTFSEEWQIYLLEVLLQNIYMKPNGRGPSWLYEVSKKTKKIFVYIKRTEETFCLFKVSLKSYLVKVAVILRTGADWLGKLAQEIIIELLN